MTDLQWTVVKLQQMLAERNSTECDASKRDAEYAACRIANESLVHDLTRVMDERDRLQAEVSRLDALWGDTISQRDHWQWEAQRHIYVRQELADLLGTEDIEEAVGAVRRLRTWAARWKAVAHHYRSRSRNLTMRFVSNLMGRVRAEREVERLQNALDSANATCNRIQGDGNALADQLHAWRQACQDHGIEATPEALRAALRRVDAACVVGADL